MEPTEEELSGKRRLIENALWIGLCFLLFLVVLSFVFWQERVLYGDAAYQVFSVVNKESLAIQVQRFGAAIVQFIPLVLTKLAAPLEIVLKGYSLAFTIYPLVFALIIWKVLRSPDLALVLVLFFGFTQIHTFYWIQSELIQGCMYSLLLMAIVLRNPNPNWWQFLLWQLFLVITIYAHPLAFTILLFLVSWYAVEYRKTIDWRYYSLFVSMVFILFYKYKVAELGSYDSQAIGLLAGTGDRLANLFSQPSTKFFVSRMWSTYYVLPIIFLVNIVVLAKDKDRLSIFIMVGGLLSWSLLILTAYFYSTDQMYMESYYLPLGIFVGVPFVSKVLGKAVDRKIWITSLVLIFCLKIGQIVEVNGRYTKRVDWLKEQLAKTDQFPEHRFYLLESETPQNIVTLNWAVPYESMLLSTLQGLDTNRSIYVIRPMEQADAIINRGGGMPTWIGFHPYDEFNPTYFKLIDDQAPMRHLLSPVSD